MNLTKYPKELTDNLKEKLPFCMACAPGIKSTELLENVRFVDFQMALIRQSQYYMSDTRKIPVTKDGKFVFALGSFRTDLKKEKKYILVGPKRECLRGDLVLIEYSWPENWVEAV